MIRFILSLILLLAVGIAHAEKVAVIGTGNVGMAIGTEMAGLGHTVIYGSRSPSSEKTAELVAKTGNSASATSPAEAATEADVIVLAVPGMVTPTVVKDLGDLSGKLIIDATNPLIFEGSPPVVSYGVDTSNGEIVQALQPEAFVVKAFNAIPWKRMIDPGDPPIVMPLAGNDANAKARVAEWSNAMGIATVDIGGIENSRVTEQIIVIMLNNQFSQGPKYIIEFRKLD
ncbi:MAG: NAD(P)-binding domain-containing protein [Pseudomonadota bacterium]